MSFSYPSGVPWLPFAKTPLAIAAWLSAFLHTALVMAFVLTPDAVRIPEPPRLTEVSIGPDIAPAPDLPAPQIVPLPDAKPTESLVQEREGPPVQQGRPSERQASLPGITEPPLPPTEGADPSPLPELKASPPAGVSAPSQLETVSEVASGEVKPVTPEASPQPNTEASAAVENIATAEITGASSPSAGIADARPADAPAPAAPLFPPDAQTAAATPASTGESLFLPVISSDDGNSQAAEILPQPLNPADLQPVTDAGPDGEAARSDAGSLKNAGRAKPVAPPKRPAASAQGGETSSPASRGRSEVYDPGVRARYSGNLFAHLRRRLVFPTDGPSGTTTIRFILDRSGRILQSGIVGSSGSQDLDAQALEIVQRAAPFPRFPEGFGSSQLEVTLPVTFKGQ